VSLKQKRKSTCDHTRALQGGSGGHSGMTPVMTDPEDRHIIS